MSNPIECKKLDATDPATQSNGITDGLANMFKEAYDHSYLAQLLYPGKHAGKDANTDCNSDAHVNADQPKAGSVLDNIGMIQSSPYLPPVLIYMPHGKN